MGLPQINHVMTAEEFLEWELQQLDRHQLYDGEVFAMAGGTAAHNTVAINIVFGLKQHLKGTPCRVFMSDMRVKVAHNYFYPDVVVSCSPLDIQDPKLVELINPKIIVEVLSTSTASFDRGLKFAAYRTIDSLQEYLILDADAKTAEVFRKNAAGIWELHPSTPESPIIQLNSVNWTGQLEAVFEY